MSAALPDDPGAGRSESPGLVRVDLAIGGLGARPPLTDSHYPLGEQAHRAISKLLARDLTSIREEVREVATALRDHLATLDAQVSALTDPSRALPDGRAGPAMVLEEIRDRLRALEAALGAGPEAMAVMLTRLDRVEEKLGRLEGSAGDPVR